MKRRTSAVLVGCALLALCVTLSQRVVGADQPPASDNARIARLLDDVVKMDLDTLPAIEVPRLVMPSAGVDVMRVRVEETYSVDGVGTDTVMLKGWIAVKHDNPRPAPGQTKIAWGTAVMDTEFVGLQLDGVSKLFGPVHVSLDPNARALGEVGAIALPPEAEAALDGKPVPPQAAAPVAPAAAGNGASGPGKMEIRPKMKTKLCRFGCNCVAALLAMVEFPQLKIASRVERPVLMFSRVETIPPVGYTASVSATPTALISEGRRIGTLHRAQVKFREVVMHIPLVGLPPEKQVASNP